MSSTTKRKYADDDIVMERASWRYSRQRGVYPGDASAQLEMMESIRNVLEDISRSQMLQCSVASDIREIRRAAQRQTIGEHAQWLDREARRHRAHNPATADVLAAAAAKMRRRRVKRSS